MLVVAKSGEDDVNQTARDAEHQPPARQGLYDPRNEHDACGPGIYRAYQRPENHAIIVQALQIPRIHSPRDRSGPLQAMALIILIQLPDAFLRRVCGRRDLSTPRVGNTVSVWVPPQEPASRVACEQETNAPSRAKGKYCSAGATCQPTPACPEDQKGRAGDPQAIARGANDMDQDALERKLYIIRKKSGHAIQALHLRHGKEFYVTSMSTRTIVYKGMLLAHQVGEYYRDLRDQSMVSALAMVHQRFSTNTFPTWDLAHPFRLVCHNGEINTLRGNVNWIRARQQGIASTVLGDDLDKIWPLIYDGQSDSASFDNALELLVMGGYSLAHAMMLMIPEAWAGNPLMDEDRRAFYEYHAALMEPWDGPAAMAFTDGRQIGATLDRNGLRPARFIVTDDDYIVMASEVGVLDIPERKIVTKWRLQPGKMLLVDTEQGRIIDDAELKRTLATAKPYRRWIERSRIALDELPDPAPPLPTEVPLLDRQQAFGYTQEDLKVILAPMARAGEEAIGSMGNDAALPVLSRRPKVLYSYFKQLFAQVTNPPIDPIREELVMSLVTFIGPRPNLLAVDVPADAEDLPMRLEATQPILTNGAMEKIRHADLFTGGAFKTFELDICYPAAWGANGMEAALASISAAAEDAIQLGYNILVVSDRKVSAELMPIPALLATAAVHQHLVRKGLRTSTGLVVETGSAREVHHFALLAGYGAEAIHPYLALETLPTLADDPRVTQQELSYRFIKAISKGLYKVMSKMGISTYQSYCGAQIFEAVGLQRDFIAKYFTGTASNVEGIGLFEIAEEAYRMHRSAFGGDPLLAHALDAGGEYYYRIRGEDHMWTPDSIAKLQHASRTGNAQTYKEYAALINDQSKRMLTLRGLFELRFAPEPVPLDEVEPASEIVHRFATGAMSLGSISTEAHTTLAIAMNRIGGKSNTGEGGEDAQRYPLVKAGETLKSRISAVVGDIPLKEGDSLRSRIKQVASARFGVTAEYLVNADQLQIKIAQGASPAKAASCRATKSPATSRSCATPCPGRPHLAAAAPRHLFDRRLGAIDPRLEEREFESLHIREIGVGGGRGHGRRGRGQGQGGSRDDRGPRRRDRSVAGVVDQARGHAVGVGSRRDSADARDEPFARAHCRASRRSAEDRPRRGGRRAAGRRRVRLLDGATRRRGLHHDEEVPPQHVSGGHRDAGSGAAPQIHRPA